MKHTIDGNWSFGPHAPHDSCVPPGHPDDPLVRSSQEPWRAGTPDCIQSVWKMVCWTYFPRCANGVKKAAAADAAAQQPSFMQIAEGAETARAVAPHTGLLSVSLNGARGIWVVHSATGEVLVSFRRP